MKNLIINAICMIVVITLVVILVTLTDKGKAAAAKINESLAGAK